MTGLYLRYAYVHHVYLKWRTCVSQMANMCISNGEHVYLKLDSRVLSYFPTCHFSRKKAGGLRGATPCAKDALTRFINRQISTTAHAALGMTGCRGGGLRGATPLRHAKKKGANLAPFNNMLGLVLRNEFF